jgi:hypothetical protein
LDGASSSVLYTAHRTWRESRCTPCPRCERFARRVPPPSAGNLSGLATPMCLARRYPGLRRA